jgi:hypothetical protein
MSVFEDKEKAYGAFIIIILVALLIGFASKFIDLTPATLPYRPPIESFYWGHRGLDILVQAFFILAAAAAVASFFRKDPVSPRKEEAVVEEEL